MDLGHWETFYRGGSLASFPVGRQSGYTDELRDAWAEFFASVPDGARVVDIATGNGAVALIAKETASGLGRNWDIHGVDLAQIDPPRDVPNGRALLDGIHFHAGVPAESLPFTAETVDALCGQYAIEYTDVPRTLREAFRVLRPGGRCQFILHHSGSVVVRNARESLAHTSYVLDELKILRKFKRVCEFEREAPARAKSAWRDLMALQADLETRIASSGDSPTLAYVSDSLRRMLERQQALSHGQMMSAIDTVERELRASAGRLQTLVSVARADQDIEGIELQAVAAGFAGTRHQPQLHGGENLVGWRMYFDKP